MVRTQFPVLDEIAKMLFSGGREIPVAHKTPEPARRDIETAGYIDEVKNRSLRTFQSPAHRWGHQAFQC